MSYRVLKFEPDIKSKTPKEHILWAGQLEDMQVEINQKVKELKALCTFENRFTLNQWKAYFDTVPYKCVVNYEHDFVMEYLFESDDFIVACIQLFACDIETSYYSLEVPQDEIISLLSLLKLKRSGTVFPTILLQNIEINQEVLDEEKKENRNALAQLRQLKEIALHCQTYEVNVKWDIKEIE
jgi:hypothetical protein